MAGLKNRDSLFQRETDNFHRRIITQAFIDVSADGGLRAVARFFGIHPDTLENYCARLDIDTVSLKLKSRSLAKAQEREKIAKKKEAEKRLADAAKSMLGVR